VAQRNARVTAERQSRNLLLGALPPEDYARLVPDLASVEFERGHVLHRPDEDITQVYFVTGGVASLLATGSKGEAVDTLMIGREGLVGLPVFLGTGQMPVTALVQVEMTAERLTAEGLRRELERGGALVGLLQRYTQMALVEIAQLVLCNRLHGLSERTARWLMQIHRRVGSVPYDVTHEFLAEMLGAQRPPLSQVVHDFRERGLIAFPRRTLQVVDPEGLRKECCGCGQIIDQEHDRLLQSVARYSLVAL
jgi:CRP-like cAMP-binding protein